MQSFIKKLGFILCMMLPHALPAQTVQVPQSAAQVALSFVPLVKQAGPAVVNIYAKRVVAQRVSPFQNDPVFGEFFKQFGQVRPRVQNSLGSGVILDASGIVVSNYHVVGGATDIRVVLADKREFAAKVLLSDAESDLAILQMENAPVLPALPLRGSDTVEVGELVLAIGNPFGVGQTVTSGIVSGLARTGTATGNARGYYIQTDAAINPGNSGGALIDVQGRLIGINTSILTRSGGSNGVGFAIPADLVAQFLAQAKAGAQVFMRPWAGMSGQPLDPDLAASLGAARPGGVLISGLHPQSPFLAAGIAAGDVILAVDGQAVDTPAEMLYRLSVRGLGAQTVVTRWRDGREADLTVSLIAPPETPSRDPVTMGQGDIFPGLQLITVNPAVVVEHRLSIDRGALILDPGQVAPRVGLRAGDVLVDIDGQSVTSSRDAVDLLRRANGRTRVVVQRGAQQLTSQFRR